jgi:putative aldouronate transport system permease protein
VGLFSSVFHWNSWFDGIIYLNTVHQWPLQSYLYDQVTQRRLTDHVVRAAFHGQTDPSYLKDANPESLAAAMIVIAAVPVMLVYPFAQRYFIHGLTLGAVKG